jgi:hypothetical protein
LNKCWKQDIENWVMNQWKKEKEKEIVCPWQEVFYVYFWVIAMSYYQKGHNGTIENYRSAQTPRKSFYSLSCHRGWIYPTKSDIFIRIQRLGSQSRSDISDQPDLSTPQRRRSHLGGAKLWKQIMCLVCSYRFPFKVHVLA